MPNTIITGDPASTYRSALDSTKFEQFNSRGFIPFQFSSGRLQFESSGIGIPGMRIPSAFGTYTGGNLAVNTDKQSWYEMWINPQKIDLGREFLYKKEHTAGAIVSFHFRGDLIKMSVSGVCGWIAINPQKEKTDSPVGFSDADAAAKITKMLLGIPTPVSRQNSPRIFLQRLRDMAEEPMYYVDNDGIEHFNPKYIKIYTKQYPDGIICEGYYTDFKVPESGEDAQTVEYSFEYMIERRILVNNLKTVPGMFGSMGVLGKTS